MVIATPLETNSASSTPSNGARLVSTAGQQLPLSEAEVRAQAGGGIARVVLRQVFTNPSEDALRVTYKLPLPADAAVSAFEFRLDGERIVGEIDTKQKARQRFEDAIVQGKTAALVEQERASVFTQEVGNIPPGAEVICEVVVDQPLAWLDEGAWEWRFPTVVGPRYMGKPGQTPDAHKVVVDVADAGVSTRMALGLSIRDEVSTEGRLESPSHPIEAVESSEQGADVRFRGTGGARLDRDIVVRWPVAQPEVGLRLETSRDTGSGSDAFGLLTVVPPRRATEGRGVSRDLIFLIDTSGSMGGRPLEQASRIASAMIDTLGEDDSIELIEFSSQPRAWKKSAVPATASNKKAAIKWVRKLRAGGATEMETGILRALDPLRPGAQRQVVVITDGYIGFEDRVISRILEELPRSCRVHTIGVGSSVNRTLTRGAARAGGGVEVVVGLGEDAERAADRLLARTTLPIVTQLRISGAGVEQTVPVALPDLYAGAPALLPLRLDTQGGEVVLEGVTADGPWLQRAQFDAVAPGEGRASLPKLFAREWVEDLETLRLAGGSTQEIDEQIEKIGLVHQIATRLTSWIAVTDKQMVGEDIDRRDVTQPQELPYGVSAEGVGLRAAQPYGAVGGMARKAKKMAAPMRSMAAPPAPPAPGAAPLGFGSGGGGADDEDELPAFEEMDALSADSLVEEGDFEGVDGMVEEATGEMDKELLSRLSRGEPAPAPAAVESELPTEAPPSRARAPASKGRPRRTGASPAGDAPLAQGVPVAEEESTEFAALPKGASPTPAAVQATQLGAMPKAKNRFAWIWRILLGLGLVAAYFLGVYLAAVQKDEPKTKAGITQPATGATGATSEEGLSE